MKGIPTLSTFIAHDAIRNVLTAIEKSLKEQIQHHIAAHANEPDYIMEPLETQEHGWITAEPYCSMIFEYDLAKFNFIQLCNMFELMHGVSTQYEFMEELTRQVICLVVNILVPDV